MIGWHTRNEFILSILPNAVSMQYNTALGFLLAGCGLLLQLLKKMKLSNLVAILLFALGFTTVIEYLFNWNLGIDELFMDHYITYKVAHKGRMAPNTAINFTLTGLLLLINSFSNKRRIIVVLVGLLGVIVLILGAFAFVGYFIDFAYAYSWGIVTKMAIHTAVGFMLIGVGVIIGLWYIGDGKKWIESSINRRLSIYIMVPIMILYALLMAYSIYTVKEASYEEAYLKLKEVVWEDTNLIKTELAACEEAARSTKRSIELQKDLEKSEVIELLKANLESVFAIQGSAVVFAPYTYSNEEKLYASYAYKVNNEIEYFDFGAETFDYTVGNHLWYDIPKNTGKPVWSEPYFDTLVENDWMLIYSVPVYHANSFHSIVTVNILLRDIHKVIKTIDQDQYKYGILSRDGHYIYASYDSTLIGSSIFEQGDARMISRQDREKLAEAMLSGEPGMMAVDLSDGDKFHTVYNPIGNTGWTFTVGTRQSKILEPVRKVIFPMIYIFVAILLLIVTIIYYASSQLSKRIVGLSLATNEIAHGKLFTRFELPDKDEIGKLSRNFSKMAFKLENRENQLKVLNEGLEVKVAERTLALETEKLFSESFLDSLQALFYALDSNDRFVRWNKKYVDASGFDPRRMTEKSPVELIDDNDKAKFQELLNKVNKHGYAYIEASIIDVKGNRVPHFFSGYKIELNDQFFNVGVGVDVSELKNAQARIIQNEKEFNLLVNNIPCVVYRSTFDEPWKFSFINSEIEHLSGYAKEDFVGSDAQNTFIDIIHPDDKHIALKLSYANNINNTSSIFEFRIIHKNGGIRYVIGKGQTLYKEDGSPDFIVGYIYDDTRRKEAIGALKDSEALFKSLVSNMPGVVYRCALEDPWHMYFMSDEVEKLTGYSKSEFVGENAHLDFGDIIHPNDRNKVATEVQLAIDQNKPFMCEYRLINRNGFVCYVYDQGQAFYKDNGEPDFLVGTISDDTERKMLEAEIVEQRTQLQKYLDRSPIGVTITSNGVVKYANEWFREKFDISLGDSVYELNVNPEAKDKAFEELSTNGKLSNYQLKIYDKKKRVVDVLLSTNQINYKGDKGMLSWIVDVSDFKRVEEELKAAEKEVRTTNIEIASRMKQLYDMVIGLPIATVLFDSRGKNIIFNQKLTELIGYTINDLPEFDMHWKLLYPNKKYRQKIKKQFDESIELAKKTGKPMKPFESIITDKNGHEHVIELHTQSLGGLSLCMLVDMDDHKQLEESLREAKILADEANRSKSSFLANMSHEIRTPMNAVLGFSELLEKIVESDLEKSYLKSIISGGKNLLALINDILDLSKIEAGKMDLNYSYINIRQLLEEIRSLFSLKTQEKGIDLIVEMDDELPPYIYVDEIRLHQIIVNLVGNAIKFTDAGYVKISAKVQEPIITNIDSPNRDISILVEDTGIGISDKFLGSLFRTFTQQDVQVNKKYGGTGLGLAISKNLAVMMNGDITVQSRIGEGSVFNVTLHQVKFKDKVEEKDKHKIQIDQIKFKPATVLIVDDIEDNRKFIKGALDLYDFTLLEACDGLEAFNLLEKHKVDLVLTDLRMPNMDGFELIKQIDGDKRFHGMPVIAISASVLPLSVGKARRHKFDDFLAKPVTISDLVICLQKYLPSEIVNDHSPTTIEVDVPIQINGDVNEFIKALEILQLQNKSIQKKMSMNEMDVFSSVIKTTAEEYKVEDLQQYGHSLKQAIDNFDVEQMKVLINGFSKHVNHIKERLEQV